MDEADVTRNNEEEPKEETKGESKEIKKFDESIMNSSKENKYKRGQRSTK